MRLWWIILLFVTCGCAQSSKPPFVSYPIHKKTLGNGLDVVVIETPEFAGVLSYNMMILAGSRNETEKGQSGLAHLFEHILFRHRYGGVPGGYTQAIRQLGAHNNAWTAFDATYYHPLTFRSNLERLAELEASRFTDLNFDEKIFQTETGAVLGEYRRISSDPRLKMEEAMLQALFPDHPYGHTTIGFYEDVLEMPKHYRAALDFYRRYYRPNNAVLVVTGDVKKEEIFEHAEKSYGRWERGQTPRIRPAAPPEGPHRKHVSWPAEVAPRLFVSFRMPPFRSRSTEAAVAQLLPELLVSKSAPLYRKLRYEQQSASELEFYDGTFAYESFDPRLMAVSAQLYAERFQKEGPAYFDRVLADITAQLDELKNFSSRPDATALLDALKNKYRYDFLAQLRSPADIAQTFAWYYRFERDPQVFERLMENVARLVPQDFDEFARKHFTPENRAVVTMAHRAAAEQAAPKSAATEKAAPQSPATEKAAPEAAGTGKNPTK